MSEPVRSEERVLEVTACLSPFVCVRCHLGVQCGIYLVHSASEEGAKYPCVRALLRTARCQLYGIDSTIRMIPCTRVRMVHTAIYRTAPSADYRKKKIRRRLTIWEQHTAHSTYHLISQFHQGVELVFAPVPCAALHDLCMICAVWTL